ncbi:MAG: glycosyl transferase family 1 [Candidatus Melainabacteria bacterium]|nr:MAG: glycosyl transferase family 1 [Candidatus Melainabacteria bacterium]
MLSWEYPPRIIGGLSRVVSSLSKELAIAGWSVDVVTADHPGTAEHELDGAVNVHRVKTQTDTTPDFLTWVSRLNFGLLQYALKLQRQKPFAIIHAHDWMVGDAAWVMKAGFGLPIVTTIHATEAGRMHGIHNELQRYIHQMEWRLTYESWEVIVNSQHMYGELQRLFGLPANKMVVIPNGTDPGEFAFKFDGAQLRSSYAGASEPIVLYVGRLVMEKGVQVLIDAASKVLAQCPQAKFLIVGTGYYLDDLRRQAAYLGIEHSVRFLGYVPDAELRQLYKIADVVAIPSLYEPFGIVALEGMAAQVPVVTSDTGGLRDFVEHMVTGITTYTGDSGSLAWGILEILRNPDLAKRLTHDAYQKVLHIYNWKVIANRTSEVYEKVISEATRLGVDGVSATPLIPLATVAPTVSPEEIVKRGTEIK